MSDDFNSEIKLLQERYDKAPESRIFAPLADAYRKSGEVEKAIELCEKGLESYPDYASAHVILGKCFYDKGATERSRAEFERVIEIDPENMVALKFTGDIRISEGDRDGAVECYRRVLAIDPTNEEVADSLKGLEDEFREREIDLGDEDKVRRVEQQGELATMTLAGIYAAQGYHNKALKIYREILEKEPGNEKATEMVEKIESVLESSSKELEETFEDEVMMISVEEVDEEMIESTSGPGIVAPMDGDVRASGDGEAVDVGDEINFEADSDEEPVHKGSVLGNEDELEAVARELEEADRMDAGEKEQIEDGQSPEKTEKEGMDNFRRWLKRMQDDSGDDK